MGPSDGQAEEYDRHPGGMGGHLPPVCRGGAVDFARGRAIAAFARLAWALEWVFKRFANWSRFGVWEKMLASVSVKADMENVWIDSTVVRAHACAAEAAASNAAAEALGHSRGGLAAIFTR